MICIGSCHTAQWRSRAFIHRDSGKTVESVVKHYKRVSSAMQHMPLPPRSSSPGDLQVSLSQTFQCIKQLCFCGAFHVMQTKCVYQISFPCAPGLYGTGQHQWIQQSGSVGHILGFCYKHQ